MIHIHRYSRWGVVRVSMRDDDGNRWPEDTQQRRCAVCGKIQVRRIA